MADTFQTQRRQAWPALSDPSLIWQWLRRSGPPRLWLRLWLAYSVLSFVGIGTLMVLSGMLMDRQAYERLVTAEHVERIVLSYAQAFEAILASDARGSSEIRGAFLGGLKADVLRLRVPAFALRETAPSEDGNPQLFELDAVSNPAVVAGLSRPDGELSVALRAEIDALSSDMIIVRIPLRDDLAVSTWSLVVALDAPYSWQISLQDRAQFAAFMWPTLLFTSVLIGLACGLVSARYVTSRLEQIDHVTEAWRSGNFERLIDLSGTDELERHARRLNAMAGELQTHLNLKQAVAVADERNRIARDLHDTVKQKLFALGLQLAAVQSKAGAYAQGEIHSASKQGSTPTLLAIDVVPNLKEAQEITREAQSDLHEIITQLRPFQAGELSFHDQLSAVAEGFSRRFDVVVDLVGLDDVKLAPKIELHLTRITQEAIANAIRHGGAHTITVDYENNSDGSVFSIQDDGCGFDPAQESDGLGFASIAHRVSELPNGQYRLISTPGAGCALHISWKRGSQDAES